MPITKPALVAALLAASAMPAFAADPTPLEVTTDAGILRGEAADGIANFRGVPFAQPPIGDLRWKAPQPVEAWPGVRSAIAFEPPCPQPVDIDQKTTNGGGVAGVQSEDCLYLNVTAPEDAEDAPVVVWFYGGGFFLGAGHLGSYNGDSNAEKGVITVTTNYRLGSLGFFAHPALTAEAGDDEVLANYTLADAIAVLEWVEANIEQFGGDPKNVTIAGQSAGGVLVTSLLTIEEAKGLFHKAIIQSGAYVGPGRSLEDAEKLGAKAIVDLGFDEDTDAETLRRISSQTLVAGESTRAGFFGTVDGRLQARSTKDVFEAGDEANVPVIAGSNAGEGGFRRAEELISLAGDAGRSAWLYKFAYTPTHMVDRWKNGPIHSAELMFTFDSMETSGWAAKTPSADDEAVADAVNACWVAFYKMKPSAKTIDCGGFAWPAYTEKKPMAAKFSLDAEMVKAADLPDGPTD